MAKIKVKYEIYTIQNVNESHWTYKDAACTSDYDTITCSRFYNKTIEVKYVGKYANSQDILHGGWSKIYQIVGGTFCTNNCWPGMKNKYIKLPQNWDDGYVGGNANGEYGQIRFLRTSTLD